LRHAYATARHRWDPDQKALIFEGLCKKEWNEEEIFTYRETVTAQANRVRVQYEITMGRNLTNAKLGVVAHAPVHWYGGVRLVALPRVSQTVLPIESAGPEAIFAGMARCLAFAEGQTNEVAVACAKPVGSWIVDERGWQNNAYAAYLDAVPPAEKLAAGTKLMFWFEVRTKVFDAAPPAQSKGWRFYQGHGRAIVARSPAGEILSTTVDAIAPGETPDDRPRRTRLVPTLSATTNPSEDAHSGSRIPGPRDSDELPASPVLSWPLPPDVSSTSHRLDFRVTLSSAALAPSGVSTIAPTSDRPAPALGAKPVKARTCQLRLRSGSTLALGLEPSGRWTFLADQGLLRWQIPLHDGKPSQIRAAIDCLGKGSAPPHEGQPPEAPFARRRKNMLERVFALPDDETTRGDWRGVYGHSGYVLCAMSSPMSIESRQRGKRIEYERWIGRPDDQPRSWRSAKPGARDARVPQNPVTTKLRDWALGKVMDRTPAGWDDHGEVYPLGKGPDMFCRLKIPEGQHILSLYFFEVDWPQYRRLRVKLWQGMKPGAGARARSAHVNAFSQEAITRPLQAAPARPRNLLASVPVGDFFNGRYKRFVVLGPLDLTIHISREMSVNATMSGLFLDPAHPHEVLRWLDEWLGDRRMSRQRHYNGLLAEQLPGVLPRWGAPSDWRRFVTDGAGYLSVLYARREDSPDWFWAEGVPLLARLAEQADRAGREGPHHAARLAARALAYEATRAQHDLAAQDAALAAYLAAADAGLSASKGRVELHRPQDWREREPFVFTVAQIVALAEALTTEGRLDQARTVFDRAFALAADTLDKAAARHEIARVGYRNLYGNRLWVAHLAYDVLHQRLGRGAFTGDDWLHAAETHRRLGQHERAASEYELALARPLATKRLADGLMNLLRCYTEIPDPEKARAVAARIDKVGKGTQQPSSAQFWLGLMEYRARNFAQAKKHLHQCLQGKCTKGLAGNAKRYLTKIDAEHK